MLEFHYEYYRLSPKPASDEIRKVRLTNSMRSVITFRLGTKSVVHRVHDLMSSWTCKRTEARSHALS